MFDTLFVLPFSFWVVLFLLLGGGTWAAWKIREGLGLPILAVLGTVAVWYVGDMYYNDYAQNHAILFAGTVLSDAWWQVAWFLTSFLILAPLVHGWLNEGELQRSSQVCRLLQTGGVGPQFQARLIQLFWGAASTWAVLTVIALIRVGDQIPYYIFPFLGERVDPWGRGQIGEDLSALLSLASYLQLFLAAMFGLVAALAQDKRVRWLALLGCCLTWPYYVFDRTRNSILVIAVPAVLSWVFVRLRTGPLPKFVVLAVCYLLIHVWFAFIIANRSGTSIGAAARGEGTGLREASREAHHEGLNMFEELCWTNTLLDAGIYSPNWGANYLANLANPIPRGLWRNKPLIGFDYAMARGQSFTGEGMTATMSTGLIGQGVVNFGFFLGPAFAALLMSFWSAFMARLDLRGDQVGYLGLYLLSMVETFNLGRDITFIALYPVIFGFFIVWLVRRRSRMEKRLRKKPRRATQYEIRAD